MFDEFTHYIGRNKTSNSPRSSLHKKEEINDFVKPFEIEVFWLKY